MSGRRRAGRNESRGQPFPRKLLGRGTGWISHAICLIDDSEVSHAALVLDGDRVAEAVGEGLRTINGEAVMDEHDLMVARSLTSPAGMEPVIKVATGYLEQRLRYAHQQIVLLAVLCATRRVPLPPGGAGHGPRRAGPGGRRPAAGAVNAMAERGQQPMVCAPAVPGVLSDPADEELLSSMAGFGTALHRARTGRTDAVPPAGQAVDEIRDKQAEADFVTPGDLLRTASLTQIHRQTTAAGPARGMARLPSL